MLSFSTDSITMNEPQVFFQLHLNRTGSLNYAFNMSGEIVATTFDDDSLYTPAKFNFPKHTSQINASGFVINNTVYSGKQTAQYCLKSRKKGQEQKIRFIFQCINITVYDEEDCK